MGIIDRESSMELSRLIEGIELEPIEGSDADYAVRVCDLTEDSRTAMPGSLFIARAGTKDEGARYIDQAIAAGAVAVVTDNRDAKAPEGHHPAILYTPDACGIGAKLAERFYGHPSDQLAIAGVTGTNGKTTIAHLTQQILKSAHINHKRIKCGLIGTVQIDDGRECSAAPMTTPPAIELSRTLSTMVEHGCSACAMEVSSHALSQKRTFALSIDAAGFTNLTGDHLDYHETIECYTQAKASFFEHLYPGSLAVINIDDPAGQVMIDACNQGVDIQRCSLSDPDAEWSLEIQSRSLDGMILKIRTPIGDLESSIPFFGDYNASNTLISMGLSSRLLSKLGKTDQQILEHWSHALPQLKLPSGRLERVHTHSDDLRVFVDFAHSDDSIRNCLNGVRAVLPDGAKLWCVFGCGGDRDRTKRPRMGQAACSGADRVVLTSDNPRSEKPSRIVDDVLAGLDQSQRDRVEVQVDRAQAIRFAIDHAQAGDVIVIAGKGHEPEQIIADQSGRLVHHEFDDRVHARKALDERKTRSEVNA